jgi:hypothetical protein
MGFSGTSNGHDRQPGVLSRQSVRLFGSPTGNARNPLRIELLVMHRNRYSRTVSYGLALFTVILTLGSVATAEWKEKVLYSFQGGTNDGSVPAGGVVFDPQGNLYGATTDGGPASCAPIGGACGAVFQLSPPAQSGGSWTETLIYQFKGKGSNDASVPSGGLIRDAAGNLYGVTAYGGTGDCVLLGVKAGCGTVYELSPPTQKGRVWTETILYSFPTAKQGYLPNGDLVFDNAGNLYGATTFGGGKGTTCDAFYQYCGAVFELSPPRTKGGKWTEKVLHGFRSGTDGANPNGGLVSDGQGNVYGTTYGGGNESGECGTGGCGTAFELKPPLQKGGAWTEKQLHVFTGGNDGARPNAGVIFDSKGNLYGITVGTLFRLAPPPAKSGRWKETILYTFNGCGTGCDPEGKLISDGSGKLYGTTYSAQSVSGTVFRLTPPGSRGGDWSFSLLYGFKGAPDGAQPAAGLVFDKAGNLYSTTTKGGTGTCSFGCGTVFKIWP